MHKKLKEFQIFHERRRKMILFFCLNLLFLSLAFLSTIMMIKYSKQMTILFILLEAVSLFYTALYAKKNYFLLKNLEENFLHIVYGTPTSHVKQFHRLMEDNLFQYHFQPIIDTKTGDIFAYEALMRTDPNEIGMMPVEILDLASKEDRLSEIEKYTIENTLKLMMQYKDIFSTKKLFINSIPSYSISNEDFNRLYNEYNELFTNIVFEIAETTPLSKESIQIVNQRQSITNCELALDDYGTGYSSESILLSINLQYVKIDKSILRGINIDTKKQQLVANLVNFASHNNIKIIAEGIETYEEFEYVINLGVDYIQGFYTAKPNPLLISNISSDIFGRLQEINKRKVFDDWRKLYETKNETLLNPVTLALDSYTDILLNETDIRLQGTKNLTANISLCIPDNHNCTIILDHVHMRGVESAAINIGNNCNVEIILIGDNHLLNSGIRVPHTSSCIISGEGDLCINSDHSVGIGIGGNSSQSYGEITIASTGNVKVYSIGNISIGIGGGLSHDDSKINLLSGNLLVETSGFQSVSIGCISGDAFIQIQDCVLQVKTQGTKAVGIGCIKGKLSVKLNADLTIKCEGQNAVCIGALHHSSGSIDILGNCIITRIHSHNGTGIGGVEGDVNIHIYDGDIHVFGEGTDVTGIGDHIGTGKIMIERGIIAVQIFAAAALPIGNIQGAIIINGGNIQCEFPPEITPINSFGTPLIPRLITATNEYSCTIETINYSYEYHAIYSDQYPFIKVYLPADLLY